MGRRENVINAMIKIKNKEIKNKEVEPKKSISGEITRTYLGPLFLCTKKVIQGSTS